jgi:hypothetical protein
MGRFDIDRQPGKKDTDLVKFEARSSGGHVVVRPVTEWLDFAEGVFAAAHANRARSGSTELEYDPASCP